MQGNFNYCHCKKQYSLASSRREKYICRIHRRSSRILCTIQALKSRICPLELSTLLHTQVTRKLLPLLYRRTIFPTLSTKLVVTKRSKNSTENIQGYQIQFPGWSYNRADVPFIPLQGNTAPIGFFSASRCSSLSRCGHSALKFHFVRYLLVREAWSNSRNFSSVPQRSATLRRPKVSN